EPRDYFSALIEVRIMYIDTIATFISDNNFITSLDKVFQKIVNKNHITGDTATKSPELLAQFCNSLLSKNSDKNDFEDIMTLFKYLEDKDIFIKFYSKMLAKRLIRGTSLSENAEYSLISKLKKICGFEYTLRLERMLTEIRLNKDLNNQFKDYWSFWPLKTSITSFIMPEELEESFKNFRIFYHSKHSGHKLNWLPHLSKGELETNYCKKPYKFMVSTYQMSILLQYNKNTSYTFKELEQKTGLNDLTLTDTLKALVKAKVLKLSNGTKYNGPRYELNMAFESYKTRILLNGSIILEQDEDKTQNASDDNDRLLIIKRTIVEIIKTRIRMGFVALVREVIDRFDRFPNRYRFKPKVPDIKKCIGILIEKEYIERSAHNKDILCYRA
ncbi:10853_t:CDS:2, partial [Dentiscutata heterogama]